MQPTDSAALRYFREVAATGSVTRAGANLFVAPSAVSRQIRLLEEELGVALFTRGARGMTLTTAGHLVLEFATRTRQLADDLRSELGAARHSVRGHVIIATVEGPLSGYVPETLETLAASHPEIRIDVRVAGSHDVSAAVAEGTAHRGFVFGPPTRSDIVALKSQPLPLALMVRPDHPLGNRRACSVRDLGDHPVALPGKQFGIRQELDRACAEARAQLRIAYEADSLALLRDIAVRTGAAIFMTAKDTATELAQGTLVRVPLTDRRLTRTQLTLVRGLTPDSSPATRIVSDALLAAMNDT